MKKLTFSSMAAARLKANKRQYMSLVLGIFLSIFLISTLVLSVYGIYQAELQKRYDKVGYLDMVVLDNPSTTEEIIRSFDEFDRFGHAYISGIVTDKNVYVGYYDEVGFSLMNLKPIEGRLPEATGEIAIEKSAMDILEVDWQIGETVELDITPVDGTQEKRSFLLVGLMLLCSGLLSGTIVSYSDYSLGNEAGFEVWNSGTWYYGDHVGYIQNASLNKQSIAQIRSLPGVKSIGIVRNMTITALFDEVPRYAYNEWGGQTQFEVLNDEQFEEAMSYQWNNAEFWRNKRDEERANYLKFLKDYHIPGVAYQTVITTIDLNAKTLDKLKPYIESGKINVDAINAGTEVIVIAPELWLKVDENYGGSMCWHSEEAVKNDRNGEGAVRAAWNDCFYAGEELPLVQLYSTDETSPVSRIDANPKIGAVLSDDAGFIHGLLSDTYIVTTEQGLENMGLLMEGLWGINVFLDGELSIEPEKTLEQQLNAIARRTDGYTVFNRAENYREREAARQQEILLYTAVSILFFSVSVGMIVSSVTRQLNSEGRTIGMLRAVGADEKAILGCYSGRINASVFGGMGICFVLLLLYFLIILVDAVGRGYILNMELRLCALLAVTVTALGLFCMVVCKFILRFRIREIVNKSIIDNIREL